MNYILKPSLQHMSLAKIAAVLWHRDDIRALITRLDLQLPEHRVFEKWEELEDVVIAKVSRLSQPEPLRKKIVSFVIKLGLQILYWIEYHCRNEYLRIEFPGDLCWTPQGTVDKKKTAEKLIEDENLDISKRYKLACTYCLEESVAELWNKMPETLREAFYDEDPNQVDQDELVVIWTYEIKGEIHLIHDIIKSRLHTYSPYYFALAYATSIGNKAATEYFFGTLTAQEKETCLVPSSRRVATIRYDSVTKDFDFSKEHYVDVLCFLLSQMNEDQRRCVFRSHPLKVLNCFLDWPWQSLFMDTANCVWEFLSGEDWYYLLRKISEKIDENHVHYYHLLFESVWKRSSVATKKYVIRICASGGMILSNLFNAGDERNIKLLFEEATLEEKHELVFCDGGQNICQNLTYDERWYLLELFVKECISSKNEMMKLKQELKERAMRCSQEEYAKNKDKWRKLFQLLHAFIYEYNKRKNEEDCDCCPTKKHCSIELK